MDEVTAARAEIAALIAELSNLGDAGNIDAFSKLFTESGTYTLQDGNAATGPSAIEKMLSKFSRNMAGLGSAAPKYMRHNVTTSHVEMVGLIEARSDTYFRYHVATATTAFVPRGGIVRLPF